jgi:hypothetical protein
MSQSQRTVETNGIIPYEHRLDADSRWALLEGSMHFDKTNAVHRSLQRIARKLDDLGISYAIMGGLALFFHGYRRFTEDVDILVTREGKEEAHRHLEGLGYVPPFAGSKNLRDTEAGVRIEFLIAGEFPGDGKPKPVAFPDPAHAAVVIDGIRFLSLTNLIELKLASGMTNPRRGQDLIDVQNLIDHNQLPLELATQLNAFVQEKYRELWTIVHSNPP